MNASEEIEENYSAEETPQSDSNSVANESPRMPGRKKKRKSDRVHDMSGYSKKKILDYLKTNGCSAKNVEDVLDLCKVRKEETLEFLRKHAKDAQDNVYQECDSLCFQNISEWLKFFEDMNLPMQCFYEQALVMDAIATHENHPDPTTLSGVDLKASYQFLSSALLGLPQPEMNTKTTAFLTKEFEALIDEANTCAADQETKILKTLLREGERKTSTRLQQKLSLDPLFVDESLK